MPTQLTMPRLSQDMESGRIVAWLRKEGDRVEQGETILIVETDKAEADVEAPATGVLAQIIAQVGDDASIGTPLAVIAAEGEEIAAEPSGADSGAPGGVVPAAQSAGRPLDAPATPAPQASQPAPLAPPGRRPASPAAKRVARELGVDLAQVVGSGEAGLVTETDVRSFAGRSGSAGPVEAADTAAADTADAEVVVLEGMRRRIAERMALSRRTAADVTTVIDVNMDAVARVRKESGLSYTSYVAWAVSRALADHPDLNATFVDDRILRHRRVNLGVAVALDDGLIVPVVRDAGALTVEAIEAEVARLAAQARETKISPQDVAGATFTLTNSGIFGSLFFTPIINVPEVAILGMGRVADVPVVRDGQVVPGKLMYLSLSYDHRAVDGATAVTFLASVKRRLENVETETPR